MAGTPRKSASPATPDMASLIAAAVAESLPAAIAAALAAASPAEVTPAKVTPAKRTRKVAAKPNARKSAARSDKTDDADKTTDVFTVRKSWKGQETRARMIAAAIWHGVPDTALRAKGGGYVDKFTCAKLIGETRAAKTGDPIKRVEIVA